MQAVGEQIRLARLRRNLSVAQVAERATCSPLTVSRIEKGAPTVAIGIYLRVLYALQLDDDILWLAKVEKRIIPLLLGGFRACPSVSFFLQISKPLWYGSMLKVASI